MTMQNFIPTEESTGSVLGEPWTPQEPLMPKYPTLIDFFNYGRFDDQAEHCLRAACNAGNAKDDDEVVFSCLIHDLVRCIHPQNHGWYSAQLFEPYVSQRVSWAIRYHGVLRFFADPEYGYEVPDEYKETFGEPDDYTKKVYQYAKHHEWYHWSRKITCNDLYGFEGDDYSPVEEYSNLINQFFLQPKEGLGYDISTSAHMWRTIIDPTRPV